MTNLKLEICGLCVENGQEPKLLNEINCWYSLGKGEVESSILSGSTRFTKHLARQPATDRDERSQNTATESVEYPWSSFAGRSRPIAALYVGAAGCYSSLPNVDPWPEARDARQYPGPWPVVAHPPCQRWGRFWHGSTRKPHQFKKGDDGGCFAAALAAVRKFGGVLEHPADSHAWAAFGLNRPDRSGGWVAADFEGGWTCYVEQGHYGHFSRKPTWLYAVGTDLPDLIWGRAEQRLHPIALERYGYEKARRIGMAAMIGGKRKTEIREATPEPFRDLLLSIAHTASARRMAA